MSDPQRSGVTDDQALNRLIEQSQDLHTDAAGSGGLGEVPVAVGEFVTVAMTQHQEHLDAWNGLITAMAAA